MNISGASVKQPANSGWRTLVTHGQEMTVVLSGIPDAVVIEEYPNYPKGPCVLLLQKDRNGAPTHVVWDIPRGHDNPVVLITAYRSDPNDGISHSCGGGNDETA